jgi:hypothetical protein
MEIIDIGNRRIAVKGIGKLFYQEGFPISMAISELSKDGVEVSLLHVADECMRNGWSAKTTINKLKGELDIDIEGSMKDVDWETVEKFCLLGDQPALSNGGYEEQREMIYQFLFGSPSSKVTDEMRQVLTQKVC